MGVTSSCLAWSEPLSEQTGFDAHDPCSRSDCGESLTSSESIAILFPGQGSHAVGMARQLANLPWARELFGQASEIIGDDLLEICNAGPEDKLARTEIAQVAIFVTSYCLFRAVDDDLAMISAGAGHSLGEYTALAAAGAISFCDAVMLVTKRAAAMGRACASRSGGMAALLGVDWEAAEKLCVDRRGKGADLWAANQNAPGQTVVAGSEEELSWLAEHCREFGARRVIRLAVSGAFHSPFMQEAAERLKEALESASFTEPAYSVWSNVTAQPHGGPEEIKALLVSQLTSPVRWADCLRAIRSSGAARMVCFGPGDALYGMTRRCLPEDVEIFRIESLESTVEPEIRMVSK